MLKNVVNLQRKKKLSTYHGTYVLCSGFLIPIERLPPFSNMTIAQSVYLLAIDLWSKDSPSSSIALGSAPASSNSCNHSKNIYMQRRYDNSKNNDTNMDTDLHALGMARTCTKMGD